MGRRVSGKTANDEDILIGRPRGGQDAFANPIMNLKGHDLIRREVSREEEKEERGEEFAGMRRHDAASPVRPVCVDGRWSRDCSFYLVGVRCADLEENAAYADDAT
jgi:hypothetical protein